MNPTPNKPRKQVVEELILEALDDPETAMSFQVLFDTIEPKIRAALSSKLGGTVFRLLAYERADDLVRRGLLARNRERLYTKA